MKAKLPHPRPSVAVLEEELQRLHRRRRRRKVLRIALSYAVMLISCLLLISILWFPVLQIRGNSMSPTLKNEDVVVCLKTDALSYREIAIFYHNNKLLVKRIIGCSGDTVDIREDGTVIRNGSALSEPYIAEPSAGVQDVPLPCQVPEDCYFAMGDKRATSLDSRSSEIGCIPKERIFGKALLRIWPLYRFGAIQ